MKALDERNRQRAWEFYLMAYPWMQEQKPFDEWYGEQGQSSKNNAKTDAEILSWAEKARGEGG
jgi:hypothetical protein